MERIGVGFYSTPPGWINHIRLTFWKALTSFPSNQVEEVVGLRLLLRGLGRLALRLLLRALAADVVREPEASEVELVARRHALRLLLLLLRGRLEREISLLVPREAPVREVAEALAARLALLLRLLLLSRHSPGPSRRRLRRELLSALCLAGHLELEIA